MRLDHSRYAATEQTVSGSDNYEQIASEPNRYRTEDLALARVARSVSGVLAEITQALKTTRTLTLLFSALALASLAATGVELAFPDAPFLDSQVWRWGTPILEVLSLITGGRTVQLVIRRIRVTRAQARRLDAELRSRRMIHAGSAMVTISFGEKGVRLKSRTRCLEFEWGGFGREALIAEYGRGKTSEALTALKALMTNPPPPATLEALARGDVRGARAQAFLEAASALAPALFKTGLTLPLRLDEATLTSLRMEEAARLGIDLSKLKTPLATAIAPFQPVEYLYLPARFFMDGADDGPWRRAVSLMIYMLARYADPPPGPSTAE